MVFSELLLAATSAAAICFSFTCSKSMRSCDLESLAVAENPLLGGAALPFLTKHSAVLKILVPFLACCHKLYLSSF
jgi:hypothetical protein